MQELTGVVGKPAVVQAAKAMISQSMGPTPAALQAQAAAQQVHHYIYIYIHISR